MRSKQFWLLATTATAFLVFVGILGLFFVGNGAVSADSLAPAALTRTVAAGARTRYELQIKHLDRRARLAVHGLPWGAEGRFVIGRDRATLYVWTTPWTFAGRSLLKIDGSTAAGPIAPMSATLITRSVPLSAAYGIWTPTVWDTCSVDIHNSYAVIGPGGKLYPTWHPPIDPATGCTFGHEHGKDPSGSAVFDLTGGVPFGAANEALDTYAANQGLVDMRHEDHVGHKINWTNNTRALNNSRIKCSILTHVHQGTHSPDAFSNNLHEVGYYARCSDGNQLALNLLSPFGNGGEFTEGCNRSKTIATAEPMPMDSPDGFTGTARAIPDLSCIKQYILVPEGQTSQFSPNDAAGTFGGLYESWQPTLRLVSPDEPGPIVFITPEFAVLNPVRYYDPAQSDSLAYSIGICTLVEPNGDTVHGSSACNQVLKHPEWTYDNPDSPFNGAHRVVGKFGNIEINNAGGRTTWYSDPYGTNLQTRPFPGSIKQTISATDNGSGYNFNTEGSFDFTSTGVHAPN
ncbi:hypothetical protein [Gloeobacter kilaueensis]|uniref:Uncharacterized protein n=1 Tax=Gloeobacter kilaueensis (strain ATCC BAA-2537 / CCAP 1431/1 / ULC 316 / JS1) TaxID=1183438 RepID=U5QHV6_GLOK1|nr:hypothetical protein [Gloeobacter kilaueensis]AGY58506.1 hypothetical protein GKIL_2260 [Gloeobacter kilaueensis JS1]